MQIQIAILAFRIKPYKGKLKVVKVKVTMKVEVISRCSSRYKLHVLVFYQLGFLVRKNCLFRKRMLLKVYVEGCKFLFQSRCCSVKHFSQFLMFGFVEVLDNDQRRIQKPVKYLR